VGSRVWFQSGIIYGSETVRECVREREERLFAARWARLAHVSLRCACGCAKITDCGGSSCVALFSFNNVCAES
jgi:hypothetical protein